MKTSASEIETYQDCQRKWSFAHVLKDRRSNKYAEQGSVGHALLERYLRTGEFDPDDPSGTVPDGSAHMGQFAAAGLHLLPEPGTVEVEHRFEREHDGILYVGLKDFRIPGELVGDHKFTGNFKYAKTPEILLTDVQAQLYAFTEFLEFPAIDQVDLLWIYYARVGRPNARPVHVTVARDHCEPFIARNVHPVAKELVQLRALQPQPSTLPATLTTCNKYGGCPYRDICPTSIGDKTVASKFLEQLKANKAAPAPAPVATTVAAPAKPNAARTVRAPAPLDDFDDPPAAAAGPAALDSALDDLGIDDEPPAPRAAPPPRAPVHARTEPAPALPVAAPPDDGLILYVNCIPLGEEVSDALEFVQAAHEMVQAHDKIPHYKLAEYGKGIGFLHARLRALLDDANPTGGLYLDMRAPIVADCYEIFAARAAHIIRGL